MRAIGCRRTKSAVYRKINRRADHAQVRVLILPNKRVILLALANIKFKECYDNLRKILWSDNQFLDKDFKTSYLIFLVSLTLYLDSGIIAHFSVLKG